MNISTLLIKPEDYESSPVPCDGFTSDDTLSPNQTPRESIATGGRFGRCLRQIYKSLNHVLEYDPKVMSLTPWKW